MALSKLTLSLLIGAVVFCTVFAFSKPDTLTPKINICSSDERLNDICIEIYEPVCGYRPGVRCFTTPCTHVTYPNSCFACIDSTVQSYVLGECQEFD